MDSLVPKKRSEAYTVIRRVTLVGSVVDGGLGVLKMGVGWLAQSQALIADGVHSSSDLFTDLLVIWAARHAHAGPDDTHPYGHERIETLATLLLSLALILVAAGFAYDAVVRLWTGERLSQPGVWALIVAAVSMLAKEAVFHYTQRAAERIQSSVLRANAWHSRSDALSSLVVLLGVAAVLLGFPSADIWATLGVALMIGWVGVKLGYDGVMELIDTAVDNETLAQMRSVIMDIPGVRDAHQLRTRKMAEKIVMDAHVIVAPRVSVSEGHRIADAAEKALHAEVKHLHDVTLHVDPERDDEVRSAYHLPLRETLVAEMQQRLVNAPELALSEQEWADIRLHYLAGQIEVEIWRQWPEGADHAVLAEQDKALCRVIARIDSVASVRVVYAGQSVAGV